MLPYNDAEAVRQAFAVSGDEIACVITEACPANMGVVPPAAGFNELLAGLCAEHGALLIMDEVLTGFRVTKAGWFGREGVAGDLMTFGKVMGGGLPAAAFDAAGPRSWASSRRSGRCIRREPSQATRSRRRRASPLCANALPRFTAGSMRRRPR